MMMWQWYYFGLWVLALVTIAIIQWSLSCWRNIRSRRTVGRLPPGSMGLPLIGETIQFIIPSKSLDTHSFIKKRIKQYGPVFKTSLVGRPIVVSSDPDFNHYILQQEGKLVELWYLDSFAKIIGIDEMAKDGTSMSSIGTVHKYFRGLVLDHFGIESLKGKLLSQWEQIANQTLQAWAKRDYVELKGSCSEMVFNFTSNILFGYDPKKSQQNLGKQLCNFLEGMMSIPLNIPGTAFHRCSQAHKKALKLIGDSMEERRAKPETRRGDLLDQIMNDMKNQTLLTDAKIPCIMTGILIASFETISSILTLAIKCLTEHPLVVEELLKEYEEVLKNREMGKNEMTWGEYKSMTFTMQVVNEALRMASVAPGILRKALKDIQVNGYTIPQGWTIFIVLSAVQLNSQTYEDPLAFNPWRWKDLGPDVTVKNFIPFGGGMRPCVGAEFSKLVIAVFIHVFVTKYRWVKIKGGEIVRKPALGFGKGYYIKVTEKHE